MLMILGVDDLEFLLQLSQRAGLLALEMQASVAPCEKPDGTIVTEADLQVEKLLRHGLRRRFPEMPVLGEEEGCVGETSQLLFALDPIDGTVSYARGDPLWSVSVGVLREGRPIAGCVVAPALGMAWWGGEGQGAYRAGQHLQRGPTRLGRNSLLAMTTTALRRYGTPPRSLGHVRSLGSIALQLVACAEEHVDVALTTNWSVWDLAAGLAILAEAGGRTVTVDGVEIVDLLACPPEVDLISGGSDVAEFVPDPLPRWGPAGS